MTEFWNIGNNQNHYRDSEFAMASGDNIDARISAAQTDYDVHVGHLSKATKKYTSAYSQKYGGYCANAYSLKKKVALCQSLVNNEFTAAKTAMTEASRRVAQKKSTLDALKAEKSAELIQVQTLAEKGLTPESINIAAMAASSNKKRIIVSLIFVGVGLTAFFIIRAIKNAKK